MAINILSPAMPLRSGMTAAAPPVGPPLPYPWSASDNLGRRGYSHLAYRPSGVNIQKVSS